MKTILFSFLIVATLLFSCNNGKSEKQSFHRDTIVVHDTVLAEGTFTYNIPCKVVNIHPELPGKAMLVFWLHGGVNDQKRHNFYAWEHHMTWVKADDDIIMYLQQTGKKAVFLNPICYKADIPHCIRWIDCAGDIKHMIDDYVRNGIADENRVYLLGSSDGGSGTWDLVEQHGEWFAAAMPLSCSRARKTSVPVYWHNTKSEGDQSAQVEALNAQGCHIVYEYHSDVTHGGDEIVCDEKHLDKLFSHVRGK